MSYTDIDMDGVLEFNIRGVNYVIDPSNNLEISNFKGYIPALIQGTWESETFEVFEYVKNTNKNAIDIGAWIGSTTIWLSKAFKEVLAIDGDTVATKALKANLKTSRCFNTYVLDRPLYSTSAEVVFGTNQYVPHYREEGLGASTSQIKTSEFTQNDYVIQTITLSQINEIFPLSQVSFVKVDIEGGEEDLLVDLIDLSKQYSWELWISFHLDWWKDRNIYRFTEIFSNAIDIRFQSMQHKINNPQELVHFLDRAPFASVYLKF
jgi:FkbM family methyltransferase